MKLKYHCFDAILKITQGYLDQLWHRFEWATRGLSEVRFSHAQGSETAGASVVWISAAGSKAAQKNSKKWHGTHQKAVKETKELKRENQQRAKIKSHIGTQPIANYIKREKPKYAHEKHGLDNDVLNTLHSVYTKFPSMAGISWK